MSVLETFTIEDPGSPKSKPSTFKLMDSIATEFSDRQTRKRKRYIIVKNVIEDKGLNCLVNHFRCDLTSKVFKLKPLRSRIPLPLVMTILTIFASLK